MSQLPLSIVPRLSYDPAGFVEHSGVAFLTHRVIELLPRNDFHLFFIHGAERCGKTHLSVKLASTCENFDLSYQLVDALSFQEILSSGVHTDILVVDDSHLYLSSLKQGDSGPVVRLIEEIRNRRGKLILLSSLGEDLFSYDEHLRSRIAPAFRFEIGSPNEEEKLSLIDALAKQRGLFLSPKKLSFLENRLPRDIPTIDSYFDRLLRLSQTLGQPVGFPLLQGAL